MTKKFIAYYRVSTAKQGESGLGLEAQQAAVAAHLKAYGGRLVTSFEEIESGKNDDRPKLAEALHRCKMTGAVLAVAKLDRLARKVSFLSALMDSGVEFVACDNPTANKLTIHILAAIAEHEREQISARTKAALAAAKARGIKLGSPLGAAAFEGSSNAAGPAARRAAADARARDLLPIIDDIRAAGVVSYQGIAEGLTERGIMPPQVETWHPTTIRNMILRCAVRS